MEPFLRSRLFPQTTNMNPQLLVIGVLTVSAVFVEVHGAPMPGVTEVSETLSCCSDPKILLHENCLNSFVIGDKTLARVNGTEATVQGPFQLLRAEGKMQLLDCVDFTHETICDVDATHQSMKITHYRLTSCPKEDPPPDGAAVLQGSLILILLTPLKMLMIR